MKEAHFHYAILPWSTRSDSNRRTRDLQSLPLGHSGTCACIGPHLFHAGPLEDCPIFVCVIQCILYIKVYSILYNFRVFCTVSCTNYELAPVHGFEPRLVVLETIVLPLTLHRNRLVVIPPDDRSLERPQVLAVNPACYGAHC
jgi:hypothetical protein